MIQEQATFLNTPSGSRILDPLIRPDERWYFEEKHSQVPVFLAGNIATGVLWYLSRRNILPFLSFINTMTLFITREASGITWPPPPALHPDRKLTEAKKAQLKYRNADRLLLATGTSMACASWSAIFGIHAAKVLWPPTVENAELWRKTAGPQVGISIGMAVAMSVKSWIEANIAYAHRYD